MPGIACIQVYNKTGDPIRLTRVDARSGKDNQITGPVSETIEQGIGEEKMSIRKCGLPMLAVIAALYGCNHSDAQKLKKDAKATGEAMQKTASDAANASKRAAEDAADATKKAAQDASESMKRAADEAAKDAKKAADKAKQSAKDLTKKNNQ